MIPNALPSQPEPRDSSPAGEVAPPSDVPAPSLGIDTPEEADPSSVSITSSSVPISFTGGPAADVPIVHDTSDVPMEP